MVSSRSDKRQWKIDAKLSGNVGEKHGILVIVVTTKRENFSLSYKKALRTLSVS